MSTHSVTDSTFAAEVLQASTPVLVDFWAEWCAPCRAVAPVLEQLSTDLAGKIKIAKVNIEESPDIANQYRIRSIPTLILFKGGEVQSIKVGALPKDALAEWVKGVL
jgi:thioredoxin 1